MILLQHPLKSDGTVCISDIIFIIPHPPAFVDGFGDSLCQKSALPVITAQGKRKDMLDKSRISVYN